MNIYLILILLVVSVSATEPINNQETQCATYCITVFLNTTQHLPSLLQRELIVLKLKESMHERALKEKEAFCKKQDELYDKVSSISKHMMELSAETRNEVKMRNELQKQIEQYKTMIEKKNKYIRVLQSQLEMYKYPIEELTEQLSYDPADELFENIELEKYVWPSETSCLTAADTSQILKIKVPHIEPFSVPCDGTTIAGPGWTVVQRRVDNSVDFNRNWEEYKNGFGDLNGNLFIGLEKLHRMTNSQPHELYIHLNNFRGESRYAHYKNFSIGGEGEAYALKVLLDYSGNAGDALQLNRNMKFSTFDRDNDESFDNCAAVRKGGWWYNQCSRSNLNGQYLEGEFEMWDGIWWWAWQEFRTLKSVQMLIRPTNNTES